MPFIVDDRLVKASLTRFVSTFGFYVSSLLCADKTQAQVLEIPDLSTEPEPLVTKGAHK